MLVAASLHILGAWDLNLNVRSVAHLFLNHLLLASRAVKVLSRLIHQLGGGRIAHGQIDMLRGAPTRRSCAPLRRVVPVALNALYQLASLGIDLSEGVHSVVLIPCLVS